MQNLVFRSGIEIKIWFDANIPVIYVYLGLICTVSKLHTVSMGNRLRYVPSFSA